MGQEPEQFEAEARELLAVKIYETGKLSTEPAAELSCLRTLYNARGGKAMEVLDRITRDPDVMGGKPCIRGLRVTVGTIVGLLAAGHSEHRILEAYPYLEPEDIRAALTYAAWRSEELEVPLHRESA